MTFSLININQVKPFLGRSMKSTLERGLSLLLWFPVEALNAAQTSWFGASGRRSRGFLRLRAERRRRSVLLRTPFPLGERRQLIRMKRRNNSSSGFLFHRRSEVTDVDLWRRLCPPSDPWRSGSAGSQDLDPHRDQPQRSDTRRRRNIEDSSPNIKDVCSFKGKRPAFHPEPAVLLQSQPHRVD